MIIMAPMHLHLTLSNKPASEKHKKQSFSIQDKKMKFAYDRDFS